MEKLINFIVSRLVDQPKKIKINKQQNPATGLIFYTLTVAPEDMGKIIGRKGKIIKAIRTLINLKALLSQKKVIFSLQQD